MPACTTPCNGIRCGRPAARCGVEASRAAAVPPARSGGRGGGRAKCGHREPERHCHASARLWRPHALGNGASGVCRCRAAPPSVHAGAARSRRDMQTLFLRVLRLRLLRQAVPRFRSASKGRNGALVIVLAATTPWQARLLLLSRCCPRTIVVVPCTLPADDVLVGGTQREAEVRGSCCYCIARRCVRLVQERASQREADGWSCAACAPAARCQCTACIAAQDARNAKATRCTTATLCCRATYSKPHSPTKLPHPYTAS